MTSHRHLGYDVQDATAIISLRRPEKANAITTQMAHELHDICRTIDDTKAIRVAVLVAEGKTFSAGSDIETLKEYASPVGFRRRMDYCDAILGLRKPIIAAINGPAYGGGLELAISCDVRIASPKARFAAPEVGLGWIGGGGNSQLLPRICGLGNAAMMLLTGEPVSVEEAFRTGLVQRIVEEEALLPECLAVAGRIAANAPIAVESVKAALRIAMSASLEVGMQYEEELVTVCMSTKDRDEGIQAFRERRPPRFVGQ